VIERVAILSTGDELTTGRIVDSNASWIADQLFALGLDLVAVLTVGDYADRLAWAWEHALEQAEVVISTGGIGPTADDLTNEVVARVLGVPLAEDGPSAERIRQLFAALGREMPENNLKQALLPRGAVVVPNPLGTAPGYRVEHRGRHLVVLPGVPREMKVMMEQTVLPWLRTLRGGDVYLSRVFQTFGLTESALDEKVAGAVDPTEARVSFRASFPEISLRLVVHGKPEAAAARLEILAARIRERIGPHVYGEGPITLEEVAGRLLAERRLTLALAESMTGGLVAHRVTNVSGSSEYLRGAVVAYTNRMKCEMLGVRQETLDAHGAVSEQTATEMADGVRRVFGTDLGLATTGIAGPEAATAEKPAGTLWLALASASGGTVTRRYQLWGERDWMKILASQIALDWLRRYALGQPVTDSQLFRPRSGRDGR